MIKKAIFRGITSFMYAAGINLIIFTILIVTAKEPGYIPVVPEYAAYFSSKTEALLVQCILIAFTSAVFGAGSVIMELERLSLLVQSILYFVLTSMVYIPISCFCWRTYQYLSAFISVLCSYTISYIICWVINYRICRNSIQQINQKLTELQTESEKER